MKESIDAIFLFASELTGSFKAGSGNKEDKTECGKQDYISNNLHGLDLTTEGDRSELNENMWLERLYNELDEYFSITKGCKLSRGLSLKVGTYRDTEYHFSVPVELDASASNLSIVGILLNDKRLMEMTNVIGETLQDPWKVEGLSRLTIKKCMTPKLYGSSATPQDLWKKAKLPYTTKDVDLVNKELQEGAFGLANTFKDFIINNCNPKPTMHIKIHKDEFTVDCNKFRNVGDVMKAYKIWDSVDEQYNTLLHTDTKKVPDLEQFRLYMVTLLVHGIDSIIMDSVVGKLVDKYNFGISIHDAVVCSPNAASDVRKWYNEELLEIHNNRKQILKDFFRSIGITGAATEAWEHVKSKVVAFEGNLKESLSMPLK